MRSLGRWNASPTGPLNGAPIRRWATLSLGLLISGVLLYVVLRQVSLDRVLRDLAHAEIWPLALSLVVQLGGIGAMAWRLRSLLRSTGNATIRDCFHGQILGFAANCIVPLRLGELAKVDAVARRSGISRASILAAVGTERLLDLFCLLVLLVFAAPVALARLDHRWVAGLAGATLMAGIVAWWLAARPSSLRRFFAWIGGTTGFRFLSRFGTAAQSFAEGLGGLRSSRIVLESLLASAIYWGCAFISIALWLRAFSLQAPWFAPAVVLVFLAFGTAIPASPGYVGTYDYFFLTALGLMGIDAAAAGGVVLVGHALNVVPFTLLGVAVAFGDVRDVANRVRRSLFEHG